MKNIATNNLNYNGTVTLSKRLGSKKIPLKSVTNSGKSPLFKFFADCLAGNFDTARVSMPAMIKLLRKDDKGKYTSASGFVYLRSVPEKIIDTQNDTCVVVYSFEVSYDQVVNAGPFTHIGLYGANAHTGDDEQAIENFSAICDVDIAENSISSVLLVDWKLTIENNSTKNDQYN
jgi:hypothetical protein